MKKALGGCQGLLIHFLQSLMLYDVLPPLALFLSFGGIIILMSRVLFRMRNQQLAHEMHVEVASSNETAPESLLKPGTAGVHLVKNRLVHAVKSVRTSAEDTIEKIQEGAGRMKEKAGQIEMPQANFREKIAELAQRGRQGVFSLGKGISSRMPNPKARLAAMREKIQTTPSQDTEEAKVTPTIRLVRHTPSGVSHSEPTKSGIMSSIRRRETKQEGPLEQAQHAITTKKFDVAEDILVPYIMKHASDAKAYMLLGNVAIGKESWEEAIEIFGQVIKLDRTNCEVYAQLGHAALNAGKFTQAIEALQHARDLDATNIQVREELLFIARRMDNKVVEKGVLEELQQLKEEV